MDMQMMIQVIGMINNMLPVVLFILVGVLKAQDPRSSVVAGMKTVIVELHDTLGTIIQINGW